MTTQEVFDAVAARDLTPEQGAEYLMLERKLKKIARLRSALNIITWGLALALAVSAIALVMR